MNMQRVKCCLGGRNKEHPHYGQYRPYIFSPACTHKIQGRIIPIIKTSHSSHKQSVRVDAVRNAGHKSDHVFTADDPESISLCRETCRNFIHSVNVFFSQDVNIEHIACTHPGQTRDLRESGYLLKESR